MRIVLVAAREQIAHVDEVARYLRGRAINLAGASSLLELAALLKKASLMISNDSGPMHLAAALGTPVIGLFGPTDPRRVGPYGVGHVALRKDVDCSRCSRRACVHDAACVKAIGVDEVSAAARAILDTMNEARRPPAQRAPHESTSTDRLTVAVVRPFFTFRKAALSATRSNWPAAWSRWVIRFTFLPIRGIARRKRG